jgi:hypothetical protein
METLLIVVTITALAVAIASSAFLMRVLAQERRRSDARVLALKAAATVPASSTEWGDTANVPLLTTPAWRGELVAAAPPASSWNPRTVAAAVGTAVFAVIVVFLLRVGDRGDAVPYAVPDAPSTVTLDLLSLAHTQNSGTLTITGLVQNPAGKTALSRVTATASAFATDGSLLASGRAPLDLTTLGAGEESPFVIEVPVRASVARYRIGFRDADDQVIAHLDRRAGSRIATK